MSSRLITPSRLTSMAGLPRKLPPAASKTPSPSPSFFLQGQQHDVGRVEEPVPIGVSRRGTDDGSRGRIILRVLITLRLGIDGVGKRADQRGPP